MNDENTAHGADGVTAADLTEADQNLLHAWFEQLILLDPRYDDKRVRRIGARAMVDDEFRCRLVDGTGTANDEESESPDRIGVRFFANTPTTLSIVLPPKAGASENFPARLRDALVSRTSNSTSLFGDDWWDNDPDHADHGTDGTDVWDSGTRTAVAFPEW